MAPAVCIASGIGASNIVRFLTKSLIYRDNKGKYIYFREIAI
jgi:hypothetical protein